MTETSTDPSALDPTAFMVLSDESKLSILMGLNYFTSLNLTQIATFTGKTKPTIYHHLKSLAEHKLIELDQNSIAKSGKYYRLTPQASALFDLSRLIEPDTLTKSPTPPNPSIVATILRTFGMMVKNISNFTASYLEQQGKKQNTGTEVDPDVFMTNLILANEDQEKRLEEGMNNLLEIVLAIAKENKDLTELEAEEDNLFPVNQFIYFLSAPISRMKDMIHPS